MDSQRFDGLARAVSRRGFFRTIAGALAGGAAGVVAAHEAAAGCTKVCGPEEYMGSGCVCRCKATGRPAAAGGCPCSPGLSRCGVNCIPACTASDQCHVAGVCDPATGACTNPAVPNGTPCNDGNSGTSNDVCTNGVCAGSNRCAGVVCTPSDQCHLAGVCDPATGSCSNPIAPNGTACNDGNPATVNDICTNGVCAGINRCAGVVCTAQDQCHVAGVCDPATGICSNPNAPDGTSCNDGNACTEGDACHAGVCGGGTPVTCTTDQPCREVYCDQSLGCQTRLKAVGASCGDGNTCNGAEVCNAVGECVPGSPVSCGTCLRCNATNGSCEPDPDKVGQSCTPSGQIDHCFGGYQCTAGGVCAGVNAVVCTALDQCHVAGTCDPSTGECSNPDAADGTTCDGGVCTDGTCESVNRCAGVVCTPMDSCHTASCNPATGGCDNNPIDCNDGNPCSTDSCDTVLGCQHAYPSPRAITDNPCFQLICDGRTGDWVPVPTGQCYECTELALCTDDRECCSGLVCAPYAPFGGRLTCIPLPCGGGDCQNSCGSYVLAGQLGITSPIQVNRDVRVSLNGIVIYDSLSESSAYNIGPIPFDASAGDTLTFEALNTFGGLYWLSQVGLFCADGSVTQLVTEGYIEDVNTQHQPTTTPFLTATIVIDI